MDESDLPQEAARRELKELRRRISELETAQAGRAGIEEDLKQKANLLDLSIDSVFVHDLNGDLVYINKEAHESRGYTHDEMMRLSLRSLAVPEQALRLESRITELVQKGEATFESAHFRKDGSVMPIEVHARLVDTDGRRLIYSIARDISERRRTADALRESEARYRKLVESVTDYMYTVDVVDGSPVATRHGPGCVAVTGYTSAEYDADPHLWYKMICPEDGESVLRQADLVQADHPVSPLEHRIIHKDGSTRWVRNTPVPRHDKTGRLIAYDGLISDITERKRLEEDLLKAKKLESVGILAGGIAHDFNNLLSIILGNISFARMHLHADNRATAFLTDAERACGHAKELSYRLLTFSKGGEPVKRVTSIAGLIRESAALVLSGSNIACDLCIPEGLCPVEVDCGQMQQVLNNLLLNAKEAMPGGGHIRISAENIALTEHDRPPLPAGRYLMMIVRDEGKGIPEEHLEKIFDPYFTTKGPGSRRGMGLGLSICHSIISKHAGLITVRSGEGRGTEFAVYLPAASSVPDPDAPEGEDKSPYIRGRGRVLLMDDEEGLRDIATEILAFLGYDATTVKDGQEAVETYRAAMAGGDGFAAAILDLTVQGGRGGADVVREIREMDPHARCVVSSGYADDPLMADYAQHGFVGAISKPYTVGELGMLLQRVINSRET